MPEGSSNVCVGVFTCVFMYNSVQFQQRSPPWGLGPVLTGKNQEELIRIQ